MDEKQLREEFDTGLSKIRQAWIPFKNSFRNQGVQQPPPNRFLRRSAA